MLLCKLLRTGQCCLQPIQVRAKIFKNCHLIHYFSSVLQLEAFEGTIPYHVLALG